MTENVIYLDGNMQVLPVPTLLNSWGLSELCNDLAEKGITDYECLKLLTISDLDRLIPDAKFGLRVKFREKLLQWRIDNEFQSPLAEIYALKTTIENKFFLICTEISIEKYDKHYDSYIINQKNYSNVHHTISVKDIYYPPISIRNIGQFKTVKPKLPFK